MPVANGTFQTSPAPTADTVTGGPTTQKPFDPHHIVPVLMQTEFVPTPSKGPPGVTTSVAFSSTDRQNVLLNNTFVGAPSPNNLQTPPRSQGRPF